MKFTVVLVTLLSLSWAIKVKKVEDPKDKREAGVGYASSSHGYPLASLGHEGGGAGGQISIGAGYSIGGAKPSFSYGLPEGASLQQLSSEGLQSSGHGNIQLAPITIQPGQAFGQDELHQLMNQISQGLSSGAISIPNAQADGGAHGGQELSSQFSYGAPSAQLQQYSGAEQSSVPSYAAGTKGLGSYGSTGPVLFNPSDSHSSQASLSYAGPASGHSFADASSLSLGDSGHSFAGLTGHSLGGASLSQANSGHSLDGAGHSFGGAGHSLGGAGYSLGGAGHSLGGAGLSFGGAGHSLGGAGHSLGGFSLGDAGHSFGGAGNSFGGAGHSLGGAGLSLGGSGYTLGGSGHSHGGSSNILSSPAHSYGGPGLSLGGGHSLGSSGLSLGGSGHSFGGSLKSLNSYSFPGKASFKPSAYVGSLSQGDSGHAMSLGGHSFSGGHGGMSLSSASHGPSFSGSLGGNGGGSNKFIMQTYLPAKSESFPSFAAYSAGAHSSSPPATTYGTPSGSYLPANSAHAESSHKPYYVMAKQSSPSFGKGSSSFRAPMSHGHSSLSSYSSPKHSFGGHSASSYPKYEDAHGAHSETSYNTIKYSEELKPRSH